MTDDIDRGRLRRAFFEGYSPPPGRFAQRVLERVHEAPEVGHRRSHRLVAAVAVALAVAMVGTLMLWRAHPSTPAGRPPARPTAPTGAGCLTGVPPKLIVIDLATQELVAYENGCPRLRTRVTTGRPKLRTPTGTFHVLMKSASFRLASPYPRDSQNWYPTVTVHDYLAIDNTGVAIHSAEWEPASEFGPGSENGPNGTYGDVNVESGPLHRLYAWADVGTTVLVR